MKLEIGRNADFEIRREQLVSARVADLSVLFISDLHFNSQSEDIVTRLYACVLSLSPSLILLGGDYVDNRKGLRYLERLLASIAPLAPVFAIPGNHDYFFGIGKIRSAVHAHEVVWLENSNSIIEINGSRIGIANNPHIHSSEKTDLNILCLHKPVDPEHFHLHYDLAFAGHLHGGQFVFWENRKGLFPGRLFYKWNIRKAVCGNCLYLVSKGLGDTLPIRYNCVKDVIFVKVK